MTTYRPYWPHGVPLRKRFPAPAYAPPVVFGFRVDYDKPINREGCGLRTMVQCSRSASWTVRFRIIEAGDETKWVRFDVGGLSGLSFESAVVPDVEASPDATGPGGAPDFRAIGALEVDAGAGAGSPGDFADFDDLEWVGGSLNGVVLDGGDLVNQEQGDPYWPEESGLAFWAASDAAEFWADTNFLPGTYEFVVTPDSASIPCDLRIDINSDVGVDYFLEYEAGGQFVAFPGLIPVTSTDPLTFRLKTVGGSEQGRVTQLDVIFDVPDEREELIDVTIAASGTVRLPITKSYRSIRRVELVILNAGGKSWALIDKDPDDGPAVEVYTSSSGARVSAQVDAFVEGVRGQ